MKYYVYAHYTKDKNELFYIGKGKDDRAFSKRGRNKYWNSVVNKYGYIIKILKENLSERMSFEYEKYFIKKFNPKCNLTPGGYGGHTWSTYSQEQRDYSQEQREKTIEKCSNARIKFWEKINIEDRRYILRNVAKASSNKWEKMDPEAKSREQARRASFRREIPVYCITNGTLYGSAVEAAKAFNIHNPNWVRRVARGERPHTFNIRFKYVTSDNPTLPTGNIT